MTRKDRQSHPVRRRFRTRNRTIILRRAARFIIFDSARAQFVILIVIVVVLVVLAANRISHSLGRGR